MTLTVCRARIDRAGVLVSADPPLAALQARAGGQANGPLAVPQLARLALLAIRLGQPISRPVLVGAEHADITLWVRITPDDEGASIDVSDWTEQPVSPPVATAAVLGRPLLSPSMQDGWRWRCDAHLRMMTLEGPSTRSPIAAQEWESRSLSQVFALQPDDDGQFPILIALASQRGFLGQRAILRDGGGSEVPLVLAAKPVSDSGEFSGFAGTADIWKSEALESAGTVDDPAFHALPLADPSFGRKVDGALRGPLGRIIATAETISGQLEGPIRQDYARYAGDIAEAGRHLLGLVDDLSDLQMVERPEFRVAQETVDLADAGRRAAGLLAMKAKERDIRIDAPGFDDSDLATGEFRRVLQILINLVGNAVRYAPEGSMIWLRSETGGGRASITVADQGQGLSAEEQARVFEKFERLGRTDSGGSGLGLYISQRLAKAMRGSITIDSAPGQGARFTLDLPAADVGTKVSAG